MKILITGSRGFIGKNLAAELRNRGYATIYECTRDTDRSQLRQYAKECDFVFHLAGANRPTDLADFSRINVDFAAELIGLLKDHGNLAPVVVASSIQATNDTPYGISKRRAEQLWFDHAKDTGAKVYLYRLPNVFGKWCKPNYNSVVATFCYNIARGYDFEIHREDAEITLCYIDDVVSEFVRAMQGSPAREGDFCKVEPVHRISVKELADKIISFRKSRETLVMPSLRSWFDKALYATYLSYLEETNFSYFLPKREDDRGWLAEFIKSEDCGQIFISKTKPGITRGNHWHHTKVEKFLVVQGEAVIKFRCHGSDRVLEYRVSGDRPQVVDIPAGYIHSITNTGANDVITLFWASEIFDPERPDTHRMEV